VGAFLQFFEFKGIHQGIQPALVTFIMYSYPTWILIINLFNKRQTFIAYDAIQSISTVVGIYFLSQMDFSNYDGFSLNLIYPLLASGFIAAWIILSNRLRKKGVGSFELSAYYDLFSILALLVIFNDSLVKDWPQFLIWANDINHILELILYSLVIGLLPNLMFYFGSRNVSSHIAGTMMAFEPFFSALYSTIIWKTTFGSHFILGGIMIMFANIPKEVFENVVPRKLAHED
jgi:drug/metabolite transporter (DMT)-like permease